MLSVFVQCAGAKDTEGITWTLAASGNKRQKFRVGGFSTTVNKCFCVLVYPVSEPNTARDGGNRDLLESVPTAVEAAFEAGMTFSVIIFHMVMFLYVCGAACGCVLQAELAFDVGNIQRIV